MVNFEIPAVFTITEFRLQSEMTQWPSTEFEMTQ